MSIAKHILLGIFTETAATSNLTSPHVVLDAPADVPARAIFTLYNDGTASKETTVDGETFFAGEWLVSGAPSAFECRATITAGHLNSGTTGVWLNLATTRIWMVEELVLSGVHHCGFDLEIRTAADGMVRSTSHINLTASAEP